MATTTGVKGTSAVNGTNGVNGTNEAHEERIECDVVVVGGGFSGISSVYRLRKLGFKVQGFEAGSDFGGVWHWNRYPGARVDSETPYYQLSIPEVYNTWNFSCRFPDHVELRKYCQHIDKTLNLSKDYKFNSKVISCDFDNDQGKWTIRTDSGHVAVCKYLVLATGLLHKKHSPDWPGMKDYKGTVHHSSFWPEDVSVKGKKVAVIGAGATSVQIVQEVAKEADNLTVFMRRPSYCFPMRQRKVGAEEQEYSKVFYERLFQQGRASRTGFPYSTPGCGVFDVTDEEREAHFEETWKRGAFQFTLCNYNDVVLNRKANRVVYDFWAKKIRERITDPVKKDLMAPLEPPYHFGTKRSPLENDYYECLDMKHVDIVNLNDAPIKTFTETGIVTADGVSRDFDIVILATGFDSFTGSLTNMGLKNKDGVDMKDLWKDGVWTYLGMLFNGFPNTFMVYSPHAPTAFSNGPTIIESQVDFVITTIQKLEAEKIRSIEPTKAAEEEWKGLIKAMNDMTLFPETPSWWTGGNIPGKKAEPLTYVAGIDSYEKDCHERLDGWKGFEVVKA